MINCMIVFEKPASKFPIMYIVMAAVNAAFLPNISLNLPYNGWKQVVVKRYAAGTHDTMDPALKAAEMVGRAVATLTVSRAVTSKQRERPKKQVITFLKGRMLVWSVSFKCPSVFVISEIVGKDVE